MGIKAGERTIRNTVETVFSALRERDDVDVKETAEQIKQEAMAEFEHYLDAKIANLQDNESLVILYRVDIVKEDGKVRGGSGSQRNMPEYAEWRSAVYKRDNWTCQECGKNGDLNAHHIKSWEHHPDLRFDVENGVTLCKQCHALKHSHLKMID